MKRTIIITGIIAGLTIIALIIFNKILTPKDTSGMFAEAIRGNFEITVSTTGELLAEKSVEIKCPEIAQRRDVHSASIKITDLVPEGTEVKEGDYVGTLDRTEFDNTLKDYKERLVTFHANLDMALLDTAITMNNMRDQIANQIHTVEEAEITLKNSKYETPTTIRQAEIDLDKARRNLEQLRRSYTLRDAQTRTNIRHLKSIIARYERRVADYEAVLEGFVITAPSSGMVIYKRDRFGNKRKVGSSIDPHDRVVATLPDLSSMISKVYISEIEVSRVKPGQLVNITVDAFPTKSFTGSVMTVANIGEKLANSDSKVFEVLIKIDGSDLSLRPSMTTNNKIIIKTLDNVTYIPNDCVHTGVDSIPVVYTKNGLKHIVVLGESNDKDVVVEKGLEPGTILYIGTPENLDEFRLTGKELISIIRERQNAKRTLNGNKG